MPSKQIREFLKSNDERITTANKQNLILYQSHLTPYTNYGIEVEDFLKSFGYDFGWVSNGINTDQSITLDVHSGISPTAGFVKVLQNTSGEEASLQLWSTRGDYSGGKWNLEAGSVASSGPAGEFKVQSYISGTAWTDIVTINSGSQDNPEQSEVTIKDRLAATSLILDGGKIHYQDEASSFLNPSGGSDTLHLEHNIDLMMMGGVDAADTNFVKWDSGTNTLEFKGAPVSSEAPDPTTTHILMDEFSLLGLGGDNEDDGNYLTAGKVAGVTDPDEVISGLLYSGTRAGNTSLDFQIENRETGTNPYGATSLTMTMKASASAGDSVRLSHQLIGGPGTPDVPALVFHTDHSSKDQFLLNPTLVIRGSSFLHSAQIGVMGSLNVSNEMRIYEGGVNFPGNLTGDKAPAANQGRYTGFKAPSSLTTDHASHVYTLPDELPLSNKVLQSDDAGVMSWVTLPTTGTGTVEEGEQYKVAYYPNVDETVVSDTSALYWKNGQLGVQVSSPEADVHIRRAEGAVIRLERNEPADIVEDDLLGAIEFYGFDDAAHDTFGVGAKIVGEASGTWSHSGEDSSLDTQTELQFWTTPNAGSLTNRMTIEDSGVIKHEKATYTNFPSLSFAATLDIDLDTSNLHKITLTDNITFTFSNSKAGQRFIVRVLQDGSGNHTIAWPSGISWASGGTAPTHTATANRATVLGFLTTGSDTYDGFVIGKDIV